MEVEKKNNKRGRAYICGTCEYINEKKRVTNHVYREHLSVDQSPFYCTLCGFRSTTKRELNNHLVGYKAHLKAVREKVKDGAMGKEEEYLIENVSPYVMTEKDVVLLGAGVTQLVWEQRAKKVSVDKRVVETVVKETVGDEREVETTSAETIKEQFPAFEELVTCGEDSFLGEEEELVKLEAAAKEVERAAEELVKQDEDKLNLSTPTLELIEVEPCTSLSLGDDFSLPETTAIEENTQPKSHENMSSERLLATAIYSLNQGVKALQEGIESNRRAIEKGLEENRKMLQEGLEKNRGALVNGLEANKRASMNVLRVMHSQDWGFKGIKDAFWDLQSSIKDLCRSRPVVVARPSGSFSHRAARARSNQPRRGKTVLVERRSTSDNRPRNNRLHSTVQRVEGSKKRSASQVEEESGRKKVKATHREGKENCRK